MNLALKNHVNEIDFWRMRNFLREVFLLNDRKEGSWHVARLDHWRWHFILTCHECEFVEKAAAIWETNEGIIAAVINLVCHDEIRLHVHPEFRNKALLNVMLDHAENCLIRQAGKEEHLIYSPADANDNLLKEVMKTRGYCTREHIGNKWYRELDDPIPDAPIPSGYIIRSMGDIDEHPARSWSSWRAFHAEEPDSNYDGDHSWFANIQSAPLYRRDLDIVAVTTKGEIASFCTISYDDYTQSAVCVLVGTAAEHWRRGLGKATITEGMRRLKRMGCTRIFATAYEPAAHALYGSVMKVNTVSETWVKVI